MSWDPQRDDDVLCCCEYYDSKGLRNHLVACCCNCQDLDILCESIVSCSKIQKNLKWKILSTISDRMRVPWRGGAVKISIEVIAPPILIPLLLVVAAQGPWMSVITFSFLPIFLLYAHFLSFQLKPQNQFFISWTITSTSLLFITLHSVSALLDIRTDEYFAFVIITAIVLYSLYKVKQKESICFVNEDLSLDGDEWCPICNISCPPRAFHCTSCNACILKRDQHCVWLNCCIGQHNHFWYIMFLVSLLSQLILSSNLILTTACHPFALFGPIMLPDDCSDVYFDMVFATCFVVSIYCIEGAIFIASVLILECWLITLGITGHEFRNRSKRSYCCGLFMSRPYSRGFFHNWSHFWKG